MNNKISVPQRSTLTLDSVDGDLIVGSRAVVKGTGSPATVKVTGTVYSEEDVVFESKGIKVHMTPQDAEILGDSPTIIDFVDTEELGRGFLIQGPEGESCGCGHEHGHEHEHGGC